jgi:hypothetical protein
MQPASLKHASKAAAGTMMIVLVVSVSVLQ